jgi:hypothetical protein
LNAETGLFMSAQVATVWIMHGTKVRLLNGCDQLEFGSGELPGLQSTISLLVLGNQSELFHGQAGEKHRRRLARDGGAERRGVHKAWNNARCANTDLGIAEKTKICQ